MLDLSKYKETIMNAAWDSDVSVIGMDAEDIKSTADFPTLVLGVWSACGDVKNVKKIFMSTIISMLKDDQPFTFEVTSVRDAERCDVILLRNGKWIYEQSHV